MRGTAGCLERGAIIAVAAACLTAAWAGDASPADAPVRERPACFGAAARDPGPACRDASPKFSIVPGPGVADRLPNAPCAAVEPAEPLHVCAFGAPRDRATRTIALVGDSHAGHWRGALDVVADARGWRGLSVTHTSCPLSTAVRDLRDAARFRACARWKRQVFAWFSRHPEVRTVFVAGLSGGTGVRPSGRRGRFATAIAGYLGAWRTLPRSVERIVVIRDTPKMRGPVDACLKRTLAAHRAVDRACAVPRRRSLDRDPLVAAAGRAGSSRVRTVDLTRFFCDRRRCFPVVGGALVLRDQNHMTATFATTLGPYLERALERRRALASAEHCRGAAARDPRHRCPRSLRRLGVVPLPSVAPTLPSAPCEVVEHTGMLGVCAFGVPPERAVATVALVGDSHAAHWRAALDVVARAKRWRAISIMRGGCPLSTAVRALPEPGRSAACSEWRRQVFRWFGEHPEVGTVFVSGLAGGTGVVPAPGRSEFATSVAGYRGAWRALPETVRRVVVIRDTPKMRGGRNACVGRAVARRRPPAIACSLPRRRAFDADPIAAAARRERSSRVGLVDLSRFFCGRRRCFPVVGGVLVLKDATHLTAAFSETLGPYLLRATERVR